MIIVINCIGTVTVVVVVVVSSSRRRRRRSGGSGVGGGGKLRMCGVSVENVKELRPPNLEILLAIKN